MSLAEITREAVEAAGGARRLALTLGISTNAIYQWDRVPAQQVIAVERASGVPRTRLRPDLYPSESDAA